MTASEKLKARLFGESQYEELDVDERAALVAVVEMAERHADQTYSGVSMRAALAALEEALT